ncbi:MAG: protein-disulfide reductase DsbD [Proteobacteria bacterium]|nr:protein-disulfide reductase DsbD [Pseudomonadota bacterium]
MIALIGVSATPATADEFLAPEQAFAFSSKVVDGHTVRLHWDIAAGYHLYRDRIGVQADTPSVKFAPVALPPGEDRFDPNFNKTMSIYQKALDVDLDVTDGGAAIPVTVSWQGCADAGLCYPPESRQLKLALTGLGAPRNHTTQVSEEATPAPPPTDQASSATDSIASTLLSGGLLRTIGVFWLAGLMLAFTPCVLPMVPILSSLIAGQAGPVGRGKGFGLSLAYTLGMALVYAGFGVAAGLAGEGLAASLQNPWVLGTFAVLLSTLALSMFGFYDLQMPSAIQSRASAWSNSFKGGSFVGVFIMGGVSALVVGPCVAAPLAGALVYISQTHDVLLGGSALFAMALGMGVPLLLVGLSAGSLLPRAGAWMERVKQLFGMMLLGVAIWMVSPVLPATAHMLLWAIWLLAAAALLGLFGAAQPHHANTPVAARAGGAGLAALAVVLLVGAASGGQSVLQPLGHLRAAQSGATPAAAIRTGLQFERVTGMRDLESALTEARQKGQTVMLDFYADWCVACKELETFTFSTPEVQKCLGNTRRLQADVTANTEEDRALLKRFNLFGPPGIVFFEGAPSARVIHKVIGYQAPADFMVSLSGASICG